MRISISLLSLWIGLSQAANVKFNLIAPGGKDVQVIVNGQQITLTNSDPTVPYFTGTAEIGASKEYKYKVGGQEEPFTRALDSSKPSTLNDFFNRPITYANIPKLPHPIKKNPEWTRAGDRPSLFDENYIPTIFFTGDTKQVQRLIKNVPADYLTGTLTFVTADAITTFQNVEFGIHGAGKKKNNAKQSWHWKLSSGDQFAKRNFFKLRHMEEDPTQIRERLYADVLRAMGTYVNEANLVRLFINGEGFGTFNLLDDITQFSYTNAVFYEGRNVPGLLYDGQSGADFGYHTDIYNGYVSWQPNPDFKNDYLELDQLCLTLNQTNPADDSSVAKFEKIFDVDQLLRFMVVEYLAGHWDGYWMGQTNLGLFKGDLWYFLDQDFDATFGVNLAVQDAARFVQTSYKEWPKMYPGAILINRLLQNTRIRSTFESYLTETVRVVFNNQTLTPRVLALHDFILPDLQWDRTIVQQSPGINFGWQVNQVTENLWHGVSSPNRNGGGAFFGLVEWIVARSEAVVKEFGIKASKAIVPGGGSDTKVVADASKEVSFVSGANQVLPVLPLLALLASLAFVL